MKSEKRTKRAVPVFVCWLAVVLAVWLALSGIGYALSGDITVDKSVGSVSISAGLPMKYALQLDETGQPVLDENEKPVYDYEPVDDVEAPKCVAWNWNGATPQLKGTICALAAQGCVEGTFDMQAVVAELVFTNESAADSVVLTFDYNYTTEDGAYLTGLVSGVSATENGSVAVRLAPAESKSIFLYSGSLSENSEQLTQYGMVTLTLSNITAESTDSFRTAELVPSYYGAYQVGFCDENGTAQTYVVTNKAVSDDLRRQYPGATVVAESTEISYRLGDGLTLSTPEPDDSYKFDHWEAAGAGLSRDETAVVYTTAGGEVTAVFLPDGYVSAYTVGSKLFYSWHDAVTEAVTVGGTIILNQEAYTLPRTAADATAMGETLGTYVLEDASGNLTYVLPAGVKLTVPKSEDDFGNFSNVLPAGVKQSTPTPYCTLTVPAGVTLQIDGELSVNGDYFCKQPYETVAGGKHGLVNLNENAKISVGSGGSIWCYGFIAGAGEVEILSGGHASEFLQITDWGGGTAAMNWVKNTHSAFYFSQYYVQNIEAKMTVHSGATTEVAVAIVVTIDTTSVVATSNASFIGEGGLFHLTDPDGKMTRTYDAASDRVIYDVYGSMETSGITVGIMGLSLTSDAYVLGIPGNITLNVNSGRTTLLNDFMLLPGMKVNIAEGAEVEIAQSAEFKSVDLNSGEATYEVCPVRLFIIDDYEWTKAFIYSGDALTDVGEFGWEDDAKYCYGGQLKPLPYTVANGSDNAAKRTGCEESAAINVDGTLITYSNIFTTNFTGQTYDGLLADWTQNSETFETLFGYNSFDEYIANEWPDLLDAYEASKDKCISGSGTVINNAAMEGLDGTLTLNSWETGSGITNKTVPTSGMLADMDGDGIYTEFGTGTYHTYVDGNNNTLWYKNAVTFNLVDGNGNTVGTPIQKHTDGDYALLEPDDLNIDGQRYVIVGHSENTGGIPVGYVPTENKLIDNGVINFGANDSRNYNFTIPNWPELTADMAAAMQYLSTDGLADGWETMAFVFADMTDAANMFPGGMSGTINVTVRPYDAAVYWENNTAGSKIASYIMSTASAVYEMEGEADVTLTVTDRATGQTVSGVTTSQVIGNNITTVTLSGVTTDVTASITASYRKFPIVWKFVDAGDDSVVYATVTTNYDVDVDKGVAVSPEFTSDAHKYFLLHGDQHIALSERYTAEVLSGDITLSNGKTPSSINASPAGLPVSLGGLTEPVTVFVKVDAYDYVVSFAATTDDGVEATVDSFYGKGSEPLTVSLDDVQVTGRYCFGTAEVTAGTAAAEILMQGHDLSVSDIGSDCTVAVGLVSYDHVVEFRYNNDAARLLGYGYAKDNGSVVYTFAKGYYDGVRYDELNRGETRENEVYTHALEDSPATLTVSNITADMVVKIQETRYQHAVAVHGNGDAITACVYSGVNRSFTYKMPDGNYMTSCSVNRNGTEDDSVVVSDQARQVTFTVAEEGWYDAYITYAPLKCLVKFNLRYPALDRDIGYVWKGATLYKAITEENGTAVLTVNDIVNSLSTWGDPSTNQAITNAGDKLFFSFNNYSETDLGDGIGNTYTLSEDMKTYTVSNTICDTSVSILVVPYANSVTVTDSGLGTTDIFYVDSNGKDLTTYTRVSGINNVVYSAGENRAIFGVSGLTNATVDATEEQLAAGVDSITVTGVSGDASLTVDTHSTKHKLTVKYVDDWSATDETVYPDGDEYTVTFDDRVIEDVMTVSEDGTTVTYTENSFTVTMPEDAAAPSVNVRFRYTSERLTDANFTNKASDNPAATLAITDSHYGVFTLTCQKPCVAVINNGDGTYTRVDKNGDPANNTCEFKLPANFPENIQIEIYLKGDVNGDGSFNSTDVLLINRGLLRSISDYYLKLSNIQRIVGDADGDGDLTTTDALLLDRSLLRTINDYHKALEW